jgi:hypothetical protein
MTPAQKSRSPIIKVVATLEETAEIKRKASAARLPVSAYLRTLGLGWTPRSTLDHQAILELGKINADLGRLGGLLKLWLSGRSNEGAPAADVRQVLRQIEASQSAMLQVLGRL